MAMIYSSVHVDLNNLMRVTALCEWLDHYVLNIKENKYDTKPPRGLFRTRPKDSNFIKLKDIILLSSNDDLNMDTDDINEFDFNELLNTKQIVQSIINFHQDYHLTEHEVAICVASLIKWFFREFEKPLLPFAYCAEDVSDNEDFNPCSKYQPGLRLERIRSKVGAQLSQDLVLRIATFHRSSTFNPIELTAITICLARFFSMLTAVTKQEEFGMEAFHLSIPILPSLCGVRGENATPSRIKLEGETVADIAIKHNDNEKEVKNKLSENPQVSTREIKKIRGQFIFRLQVFIWFGRRINGYILNCLDILPLIFKEVKPLVQVKRRESVVSSFMGRKRTHSIGYQYASKNSNNNIIIIYIFIYL